MVDEGSEGRKAHALTRLRRVPKDEVRMWQGTGQYDAGLPPDENRSQTPDMPRRRILSSLILKKLRGESGSTRLIRSGSALQGPLSRLCTDARVPGERRAGLLL